jgi:cardiolipin synthase A/B
MLEFIKEIQPHLIGTLDAVLALAASAHAILNKRDTRSAVGWVGLIWLVPILGTFLYLLLGINRIKRRARALRSDRVQLQLPVASTELFPPGSENAFSLQDQFEALARLVGNIVQKPLLRGNRIMPLINGDTAYPAMIRAIDEAGHSIHLSTYIFDNDRAGDLFLNALARAVERNVSVRVLIDAVGARYSWPPMTRKLRRSGIRVAKFLPTFLPWRLLSMNLRNHRKLLVIDGKTGFTGGMNIRESLLLRERPSAPVQDLHFLLEGPVVEHLQRAFTEDWFFTTMERLAEELLFPVIEQRGPVLARGIPDGPDEDFEKLLWTVHGALAIAKKSVHIMTPYFLPDAALIKSLNLAAMRGVTVDIVLPRVNNLPIVKWASVSLWWQLLEHDCHIWLSPGPFDHSKVMIVDGIWTMFGSGNWDPRSFRLNFEFNVECYDSSLADQLAGLVMSKMKDADRVTLEEVMGRTLPVKLRDGIARLFSPYL